MALLMLGVFTAIKGFSLYGFWPVAVVIRDKPIVIASENRHSLMTYWLEKLRPQNFWSQKRSYIGWKSTKSV